MKCAQVRGLFSPYLDGAVSGKQMGAISAHLAECLACNQEYSLLRQSQLLLTSLGRKQAPKDLALKLRVAISQEAAAVRRPPLAGIRVRLENALNAFLMPATAGVVTAVLVFGLLLGFFALPTRLQASSEDVPLLLYTAPELQSSAMPFSAEALNAESVVIEAYVDANGRVQDYRILSDQQEAQSLRTQINNAMIFTTFRPATSLGRPTPGRAVLSFSKVNVRG
jgi:putative zinc finger protein